MGSDGTDQAVRAAGYFRGGGKRLEETDIEYFFSPAGRKGAGGEREETHRFILLPGYHL